MVGHAYRMNPSYWTGNSVVTFADGRYLCIRSVNCYLMHLGSCSRDYLYSPPPLSVQYGVRSQRSRFSSSTILFTASVNVCCLLRHLMPKTSLVAAMSSFGRGGFS